ncbi:hypothetical protein JAAARDRAFT_38618 [Jaapia argillacea MUCL 33604]|uniref:MYND-type domain-containing protein n=1 Tax=Jaapia argillacea MUCL 33604 TaxID=933084 RepID=A0A067PJL3_9AGAM|nr:hypothetical protein JAAARDRAFT_38618 [Jaapia argillacea MUCL 33604]
MDSLVAELSHLSTNKNVAVELPLSQRLSPTILDQGANIQSLNRLADSVRAGYALKIQPLEKLFCANFQVQQHRTCPHEGRLACSACKLVSYCSKVCQQQHWPIHKRGVSPRHCSCTA